MTKLTSVPVTQTASVDKLRQMLDIHIDKTAEAVLFRDTNLCDMVKSLANLQAIVEKSVTLPDLGLDAALSVGEQAAKIYQAVLDNKISCYTGERLIGLLHKTLEVLEYSYLKDRTEELT